MLTRPADRSLRARRLPRHRGLRRRSMRAATLRPTGGRARRRRSNRPPSARVFTTDRAGAGRATASSSPRAGRSGASSRRSVRRRRRAATGQGAAASTRSGTRCTTSTRSSRRFSYTPELAERGRRHRARRRARPAEHVHLQAAAHRRRGRLPPGRHVPVHRTDDASPGSGSPSRTPRSTTAACGPRRVGTARRCASASSAPAPATTTARRSSTLDDDAAPDAARRSCRSRSPAGTLVVLHGLLPHWSDVNRSADQPPRLLAALHLSGAPTTRRLELAAAPADCRCGAARHEVAVVDEALARRMPKALLHDHLDGGLRPATVVELAEEYGYRDLPTTDVGELATLVQPGRQAQRPRALPRDVRPHGRRDAAPRRDRAGRRTSAPRISPPTVSSTPRCAWRRSCAPRQGLTLDEVHAGDARRVRPRLGRHRPDDLRHRLGDAHRGAQPGDRRARGALPRRRRGRLRHRRRRGRLPADAAPRRVPVRACARTSTPRSTPARRSACRASGRRCSGAAPSASVTACASSTTSPAQPGDEQLGRLAAYVRDRRIPLELCPTSNVGTGVCASIAEHPIGMLRRLRFRVTVNTDNRLMSDTSMTHELRAAGRRVRLGHSTTSSG